MKYKVGEHINVGHLPQIVPGNLLLACGFRCTSCEDDTGGSSNSGWGLCAVFHFVQQKQRQVEVRKVLHTNHDL